MENEKKGILSLINVTIFLLYVYNVLYWTSKFAGILQGFYHSIMSHWKLITFLEFLAVASVAIDIIIRFDQFDVRIRNKRLFLCAMIGFLFMLRFLFGVIELYMRGEVQ